MVLTFSGTHCFCCKIFILLLTVSAQVFEDIVIGRPGQIVTLLCSIASESTDDATVGWLINHVGPHGVNALLNGLVPGYNVNLDDTADLIIENIMMNDHRNDTEHQCMILQNTTIRDDPIVLYVTGM